MPLVVTHAPYKGENVWFASVADLARSLGVPAVMFDTVSIDELVHRLAEARPDVLVSVNFRKMIPERVYRMAPLGAYNIHDSLLPAYKGFAPSAWAMIRGETMTGVTFHELTNEVDGGAIVCQRPVPILPDDGIGDLICRLAAESVLLLTEALPRIVAGTAERRPQEPGSGFFMPRRTAKDDYVDWTWTGRALADFVRAVSPPVAFSRCRFGTAEFRLDRIVPVAASRSGPPAGTVLAVNQNWMEVQAGDGAVRVLYRSLSPGDSRPAVGDRLT
ncbi:MAG: hypothetical protein IT564_02970 [Rhodospirillales bacterium]|nr:hypothetical protein [Rhodospirillales bacterium]